VKKYNAIPKNNNIANHRHIPDERAIFRSEPVLLEAGLLSDAFIPGIFAFNALFAGEPATLSVDELWTLSIDLNDLLEIIIMEYDIER
jgi:hypothetical protein